MVIDILEEKRLNCEKAIEEFRDEQHYGAMEYAKGQAKAYEDAINVMKNVEEVMKEENLRRLLGRFVKTEHLGAVIVNFKENIRGLGGFYV